MTFVYCLGVKDSFVLERDILYELCDKLFELSSQPNYFSDRFF